MLDGALEDVEVVDLCAGPGGWCEGLRMLDPELHARIVGIEWDDAACLTREAAGHRTLKGDIAEVIPLTFRGCRGLIASPPCFPAGTPVVTERGIVPIESVVEGDRVLTHRGRWRPVTATMNRTATVYADRWLTATGDHPFYAREQVYRWENDRRQYGWTLADPTWTPARELDGRFLALPASAEPLPVPPIPGRPLDVNALWYVVGRWLGDGWLRISEDFRRRSEVVICCSHAEADGLASKLADLGIHWTRTLMPTVTRFTASHVGLSRWLAEHFGRRAAGKTLPGWALGMPLEDRRAMLGGYLDADGHLSVNGWQATTISQTLAVGVRLIATGLGYTTSIVRNAPREGSVIDGRTIKNNGSWTVHLHDDDGRYTRADSDHRWVKQRKPMLPQGEETVYDITVDEDHSFVAHGFVVHNCTLFSQAGSGVGRDLLDLLADAIWRILHGDDCRMEVRQLVYPTCHAAQLARNEKRVAKGKPSWSPDQVSEAARMDAYIACLVLEPARYIFDLSESLEWLAFEQVPAVLPLWRIYQTALRKMGWSVWTGILNAADYGVPQTRTRAILIGRRTGAAGPPAATHAEFPADDLFGGALPKWVSMADALGWGAARVGFGRQDDRGDSPDGLRERDFRGQDEPALTITEKARSWVRQPVELVPGSFADGNPEGNPQVSDAAELPETSGYVVNTGRDWQERGSGRAAAQTRPIESPAPTVDTGGRWWIERLHDQTGTPVDLEWPTERPATTISSRDRVTHPGANANRFNESTKSRNDGLRVTEQEAGVLQAFPADYPWQGNRTAIFRQIGDAVPPQLAAHVLASALGRTYAGGPVLATVERDVPVSGLANNSQANAARRSLDEPAGTVFFGARLNTVVWEPE